MKDKTLSDINHIAYSFDNIKEAIDLALQLGYSKSALDVFLGDLTRESFFIKDLNGNSLQLIKKKEY